MTQKAKPALLHFKNMATLGKNLPEFARAYDAYLKPPRKKGVEVAGVMTVAVWNWVINSTVLTLEEKQTCMVMMAELEEKRLVQPPVWQQLVDQGHRRGLAWVSEFGWSMHPNPSDDALIEAVRTCFTGTDRGVQAFF